MKLLTKNGLTVYVMSLRGIGGRAWTLLGSKKIEARKMLENGDRISSVQGAFFE